LISYAAFYHNSTMYHIKHFFIPSEKNNYRARTLHLDFLTALLGIAVLLSFFSSAQTKILGIATNITIDRLMEKTNEVRGSHNLRALKYDGTLAHAACNKAQDMYQSNYWAHYRPEDGKSPWDFMRESGYNYEIAGENLAHGFMFSDGVVDAWMDSPTHRDNLLKPEYEEVGFCVSNGVLQNEDTTLVVQMFGKPLAQAEPTTPDIAAEKTNLLAASDQASSPVTKSSFISLDKLTLNSSLIIFSLLLIVLVLDLYFAYKMGLVRITGKHFAHLVFLGIIILAILIIKNGAVL